MTGQGSHKAHSLAHSIVLGAAAVLGATVGILQGVLQAVFGTQDAAAVPGYAANLEGPGYRNLVSRQHEAAYGLPNTLAPTQLLPTEATLGMGDALAPSTASPCLTSHKLDLEVHREPHKGTVVSEEPQIIGAASAPATHTMLLMLNQSTPPILAPINVVRFVPRVPSCHVIHCQQRKRALTKAGSDQSASKPILASPSTPSTQFPDVDRDLWDVLELATDEELDALHATLHRPSLLSPLVKSVVASQEPASVTICGRTALMLRIEQRFRFLAVCSPVHRMHLDETPVYRQTRSWCSGGAAPATEMHCSCYGND